jgi:hypothetical protein
MKKHSEKVSAFNGDKDRLKKFLDQISRGLGWFLGMTSYKLIKVKDEKEPEKKEGKDAAAGETKMQDLIIQSTLLSGGIENRFISLFSQEGLSQLHDLIKISEDKKLLALISAESKETEDDKLIEAVIHQGQNPHVDRLLAYLQGFLTRKIPFCAFANLGGADGMRLTRAAFGVMIRFSELYDSFLQLADTVDMEWSMLEGDEDREIKMKELIKAAPHYDSILKRWESAAKMRLWINEKKSNLAQKIQKEVEADFKKEKAKAPEEKPAAQSAPEAAAAADDKPVKEDDIVLIDTSTKPVEEAKEEVPATTKEANAD